jgi:hypothetical protein
VAEQLGADPDRFEQVWQNPRFVLYRPV